MKNFKFLAVALVAMLGFTACDKDCDPFVIQNGLPVISQHILERYYEQQPLFFQSR